MDRTRGVFLSVVGVLLALILAGRFRLPAADIGSAFFDDFFYYAVIARNWGTYGFPTFDGVTATNGVQPLWMGVVVVLMAVLGERWAFFAAISLVTWICGMVTADRLWVLGGRLGTPVDLRAVIAFVAAFYAVVLSATGMEVCLAIALIVAAIADDLHPGVVGFLAALAVLARIDAIVIVLPLLAFHPDRRNPWLAAGSLLVVAYFVVDWAVFGTLLPVSGVTKQLGAPHVPSAAAIRALWHFDQLGPVFMLSSVGMGLGGAIVSRRASIAVLGLGPLWFYAVQLVTTDWALFFWYAWPLVVALGVGGMAVAAREWPLAPRVLLRTGWMLGAGWAAIYAVIQTARADLPGSNPVWQLGEELAAINRPGRWAMGDAAASMTWLSGREVVQTEGLVMDLAFVEAIREGGSLRALLERTRSDWYVGRREPGSSPSCSRYREPARAGPDSPGFVVEICGEPEESVTVSEGTWDVWPVSALPP